jgi:hypothetical protein
MIGKWSKFYLSTPPTSSSEDLARSWTIPIFFQLLKTTTGPLACCVKNGQYPGRELCPVSLQNTAAFPPTFPPGRTLFLYPLFLYPFSTPHFTPRFYTTVRQVEDRLEVTGHPCVEQPSIDTGLHTPIYRKDPPCRPDP